MTAKNLLSSTFKRAVLKLCSLAFYLLSWLQLAWLQADQHLGLGCLMCSFLIIVKYFIAFHSLVCAAKLF